MISKTFIDKYSGFFLWHGDESLKLIYLKKCNSRRDIKSRKKKKK